MARSPPRGGDHTKLSYTEPARADCKVRESLFATRLVERRQFERALEGGTVVDRMPVRDDHVLEGQLEHCA